jgi:sigma-B regulation protein RsbQ
MVGPSPCYINDGGYFGGFDRKILKDVETMDKNYIGWSNFLAPKMHGKIKIGALEVRAQTQGPKSFCCNRFL